MNREAPTAVLQAAINSVVQAAQQKVKAAEPVQFKPTAVWQGQKRGYFFSRGPLGQGYYADPHQTVEPEEDAAEKETETAPAKTKAPDAEELLREAEEQAGEGGAQLWDAKTLKRHVLAFERKYKENMEARMKYADQPEKFMDSEVDLDEEVKALLAITGSAELYPDFVRLGAVPNLLALLTHDNSDIAGDVIELLHELTDADAIEEAAEEAMVLAEAIEEANGLELMVQRLGSLDETQPDEARAVFNILATFDNLIEIRPGVREAALERTKLLKWLLHRLRAREFDSNKQYASELLAILMQSSAANQQRLADAGGIDLLLQCIQPYKKRDPRSADEEEYLENLFDALCSVLMLPANRLQFVTEEGVELLVLILREKRLARGGALKTLDFALTRCTPAAERFVDFLGLKILFSIFMGKAKVPRKKGEEASEAEEEERAVSVVASLLAALTRGSRRDRVAAKFVEAEYEKVDRLMELYSRYAQRVAAEEARLQQEAEEAESPEEAPDEDDWLLARMDAGLFTLQQCALVVGHLWQLGDAGVRRRLLLLLHQHSQTLGALRAVLKEYLDTVVANEDDAGVREAQRTRVRGLLTALGWDETAEAEEEAPPLPTEEPPVAPTGAEKAQHTNGVADVDMEEDEEGEIEGEAGPVAAGPAAVQSPTREPDGRAHDDERERKAGKDGSRREHGRDRDVAEGRTRDRDREKQRDRDRGKERDPDRQPDHDRERDRERHRDRREDKEPRDHGSHRENERHRERERERGGSHRDERERDRPAKEERQRDKDKRRREHDDDRDDRKRDKHRR